MDQLAAKLLKDHNISPKTPEVVKRLSESLDALVYNITSIVATLTLLHGSKKILANSHVEMASSYISHSCKPPAKEGKEMGGGGVGMPGEYFGLETGAYTNVAAGTVTSTIDFDRDIARGAIGGGARRAPKVTGPPAIPFSLVRPVLKTHAVSISTGARKELEAVINEHLACLVGDMSRGILSISKLNKLLKQKRYGVFN